VAKYYALILLGLLLSASANAGLFADDDARKQIQILEKRVRSLEESLNKSLSDNKQQVKSMLDLQSQIELLNNEIRKLRGQNEEMAHGLRDAEKRQKDFYVDLDTRVRHLESAEEAAKIAAEKAAKEAAEKPTRETSSVIAPAGVEDPSDPGPENRAYESAYAVYKGGNHASAEKALLGFIQRYPDSVYVPRASFLLGKSMFEQKKYKEALTSYQGLLKDYPYTPKAAEAMYDIAACQRALKSTSASRKTLKKLIQEYPASEFAGKAKKQLKSSK